MNLCSTFYNIQNKYFAFPSWCTSVSSMPLWLKILTQHIGVMYFIILVAEWITPLPFCFIILLINRVFQCHECRNKCYENTLVSTVIANQPRGSEYLFNHNRNTEP